MSRALFWTGAAVTGGVLVAMAVDFALHAAPKRAPVLPTPEGFVMRLKDLGPLEVAFAGRVQVVTDEREEREGGGALRVPRWKVDGDDPAPDGGGMAIFDTRIEALAREGDGAPPLIAEAPRAWVALERQRGLLTLDLDRPWRLTDPVLTLPGFRPGTTMTATAQGMASLHPREERVEARGPFRLEAENLQLDAAAFSYDSASGRVGFEPWKGSVTWRFEDAQGREIRGVSDAGGEVVPTEGGGLLLRFHEGPLGVRSELPVGADRPPATVIARALELEFAAGEQGDWLPRRGLARGPLWFADHRVAAEGGDADLKWDALGTLRDARLAGPLAVCPWDPPLQAAVARSEARYDPATGGLVLDGRAWAATGDGALAADALAWDGATLVADGTVVAHGPSGTAVAGGATASEKGGLRTRGGVRLLPASGLVESLLGPELAADPRGDAEMPAGFTAHGRRDGVAWTLTGERLRNRVEPDGARRAEASGALVYEEDGLRIEADRFQQTGEERFRLEGAPARATMRLESGAWAHARFRRADSDRELLHLEGEPWLQLPAADLGLAGESVELFARSAERRHADGAWELQGPIRSEGALRAEADRATWSPADGLRLERRLRPPVVEGTLADGTEFWGQAQNFGIRAERVLDWAGAAEGRLKTPDGAEHRFWADRLQASEFGGFAEGSARVESALGHGRGERADWLLENGELVWMRATGAARLEREGVVAEGERVEADLRTGWIEAEGTPARPAWLTRPDGSEVRAVWLRYNLRTHLIEAGPVRLATPDAPR